MTTITRLAIACTLGAVAGAALGRLRPMFGYPRVPQGDPSPEPDKDKAPEGEQTTIPIDWEEMDATQRAVFDWRFGELRKAGFDELRASSLALKDHEAWRRAIEHVKRGADPVTAANIEL